MEREADAQKKKRKHHRREYRIEVTVAETPVVPDEKDATHAKKTR